MKRLPILLGCILVCLAFNQHRSTIYASEVLMPFPDELVQVLSMTESALWGGTSNNGLVKYDGISWTAITTDEGLGDNLVRAIAGVGDEVWIGHFADGISRLTDDGWETITRDDGLRHNCVSSVAQDAAGIIWVGHCTFGTMGQGGGISQQVDGVWHSLPEIAGVSSQNVSAITIAPDGTVWVGFATYATYGGERVGGLAHFDGTNWTIYSAANGLVNDNVLSLYVAENGTVWIGTSEGVVVLEETGGEQHIRVEEALLGETIYAIEGDGLGNIWAGTNLGLYWFDGNEWRQQVVSPLVDNGAVLALAIDRNAGIIWTGGEAGIYPIGSPLLSNRTYLPILLK